MPAKTKSGAQLHDGQLSAVIYARYSSHSQTEMSIEGQLKDCYAFAEREGLRVVGEYIDRALTGRTDDRPDFQRMISDAKKKHFQRIIVWKLDRFARNRYDSAIYKYQLKQNGVKVLSACESISDSPEGIILEAVLEASAEYYSENLAQNIKRGMRDAASIGTYVGGPVPFGYKVVDVDTLRRPGKPIKKLVVDDQQAEYVRYCFEQYAAGVGAQEIIKYLQARGVRTNQGFPVGHNFMKAILPNRKYIGEYIHNGLPVEGGCPVIIEESLFNKVQDMRVKNKRSGGSLTAKVDYLLQGKLYCGVCGSTMIGECGRGKMGVIYHYYNCTKRKKEHACIKSNEKKDFIEWYIVEQTLEYVLTDDRISFIADAIVAEYEKEFNSAKIREYESKMRALEGEIERAMDAVLSSTTQSLKDRFMARLGQLDTQKADIEIDLQKLRVAQSIRYTKAEIVIFLKSFCRGDMMDEEFRTRIIDTFINSIYLYDDKVVIYYNIKDAKQVSYIEMAENLQELENLMPVETKKKKSSNLATSSSSSFAGGA